MLLMIAWWVRLLTPLGRLPFVLWLDNASMHCTVEVQEKCAEAGIILRFFRSHSTHWACMLDNGIFCQWDGHYNSALGKLRGEYRMLPEGGVGKPLLLEWQLKAVKQSVDAVLTKPHVRYLLGPDCSRRRGRGGGLSAVAAPRVQCPINKTLSHQPPTPRPAPDSRPTRPRG